MDKLREIFNRNSTSQNLITNVHVEGFKYMHFQHSDYKNKLECL